MSNASLKEQLQAVASQISVDKNTVDKNHDRKPKRHFQQNEKAKKPKPKWLDYAQYGVELLKAYFPACFKESNEVKPLKKGIKQDLVKHLSTLENVVTDDKACMVKSLAYYVNTAVYHKSVLPGATRIDLDGNPAGIVSAEEAQYSVDRHQAKILAKKNSTQPTAQPNEAVKVAAIPVESAEIA